MHKEIQMDNQSKTLRENLHRFFGDESRRPYRGKGREGGGLRGGGGGGGVWGRRLNTQREVPYSVTWSLL